MHTFVNSTADTCPAETVAALLAQCWRYPAPPEARAIRVPPRIVRLTVWPLLCVLACGPKGSEENAGTDASSTGVAEDPDAYGAACPEDGLDPERVYASIYTEQYSVALMMLVDVDAPENGCAFVSNSNEALLDGIVRAEDGAFVQTVGGLGSGRPPRVVVRQHDAIEVDDLSGRWEAIPAYEPGRDEYVDLPPGEDWEHCYGGIPWLWNWPTGEVGVECGVVGGLVLGLDGREIARPIPLADVEDRGLSGAVLSDGSRLVHGSSGFGLAAPDGTFTEIELSSPGISPIVAARFIDGKLVLAGTATIPETVQVGYDRWELEGTIATRVGAYAFPPMPQLDSDGGDLAQLDGQGRLVLSVHHEEDDTRTIERADLQRHEVLLSGPYVDTNGPADFQLQEPGLVVRALVTR